MDDLRFFNPYADIRHTENRLPHWQQEGAVYFVTFRLADAIPSRLRSQWESERDAWIKVHPEPWSAGIDREYHQRFSGAIEQWLDAGHGACLLRRGECAEIVAQALRYFEGERVVMISSIVMPNHVHALFVQNPDWPLEKLIHSWKRFATRQINLLLGRLGALWQRDFFDRLVRDEKHFANCVRYIRRNPEKARLGKANMFSTRAKLLGPFSEQGAAVCNRRTLTPAVSNRRSLFCFGANLKSPRGAPSGPGPSSPDRERNCPS